MLARPHSCDAGLDLILSLSRCRPEKFREWIEEFQEHSEAFSRAMQLRPRLAATELAGDHSRAAAGPEYPRI